MMEKLDVSLLSDLAEKVKSLYDYHLNNDRASRNIFTLSQILAHLDIYETLSNAASKNVFAPSAGFDRFQNLIMTRVTVLLKNLELDMVNNSDLCGCLEKVMEMLEDAGYGELALENMVDDVVEEADDLEEVNDRLNKLSSISISIARLQQSLKPHDVGLLLGQLKILHWILNNMFDDEESLEKLNLLDVQIEEIEEEVIKLTSG